MVTRPWLATHVDVRVDPPDAEGVERMIIRTSRRRIVLKGTSLAAFREEVLPLLDGRHSVEEILRATGGSFAEEALRRSLDMLARHGLLQDQPLDESLDAASAGLEPQLNFFQELQLEPASAQRRIREARVTIVGTGALGGAVASGLAAAGVGTLRCVDPLPVTRADAALSPAFCPADVGHLRVDALAARLQVHDVAVEADIRPVESAEDAMAALEGTDFAVCCADPSHAATFYRVNRACLAAGTPWMACAVHGFEAEIGPTVLPHETPCYLCYTMRTVSAAQDPEEELIHRQALDDRKRDDSDRRENTWFAVSAAAGLAGSEVIRGLLPHLRPVSAGRLVAVDLVDLGITKHVVLRKPWCPACFSGQTAQAPLRAAPTTA
jgi:bacteriocin biosynthesis cyclodehydratase domain-containing protein